MRRRRKPGPIGSGRTRIKLARMLSELFNCPVHPENIWEQNHNSCFSDCARWGWKMRRPGQTWDTSGACWDRMTECARNGLAVVEDDFLIEVTAKGEVTT